MKNLFAIFMFVCLLSGSLSAQNLEELKEMKTEKLSMLEQKAAELKDLEADIQNLTNQINLLSGWRTGFSGILGFSSTESNNWAANPNPNSNSSTLSISGTAFANRLEEKWFWNNKVIANKSWQSVTIGNNDGGDLFDNGTVDMLNAMSLYGYRLTDKLALSALGELNTSIDSFLEPGTIDIGVGATWMPIQDLTVVVHPLNYRITFPADGGVDSEGALGAKLRADYAKDLLLLGKEVSWSSTLTAFLPYSDTKIKVLDKNNVQQEAGLTEFTWLNTVSFNLWRGIGVGATFGLRKADFEYYDGLQNFYTLGLNYTL